MPEALFERQWALSLLDRVLTRLRDEYGRKGQAARFGRMRPFLAGDQDPGAYERLAEDTGSTEGAAKTAVHRLRRLYGELVREEIAAIVAHPADVEGEISFLLAALSGQ